jgi:thiol-disulfide isomerase/thioredoxin
MRRAVLLLVMVSGIGLVLWAGWQNHRGRKRTLEKAQLAHAMLVPDKTTGATDTSAADASGSSTTYEQVSPLKSKPAPAFALVDLAGKRVSLADYKGRPVVVNFWATWCGPCKIEMPWFEEFRKKYAADKLEILGLTDDADAGKEKIGNETKKLGVTYPILLGDSKVDKAYGDPDVLPMSFYVDKTGTVVEVTAGLGSKDELEAMVKEVVAAGGK